MGTQSVTVLPAIFDLVHGIVRFFQQNFGVHAILWIDTDADAGTDLNFLPPDLRISGTVSLFLDLDIRSVQ